MDSWRSSRDRRTSSRLDMHEQPTFNRPSNGPPAGVCLTMRRCAYCGSAGPLTKEHICPDFLIRESPGYRTFVDRARDERVHKSPPTIRDVCGRCNNGALSALD